MESSFAKDEGSWMRMSNVETRMTNECRMTQCRMSKSDSNSSRTQQKSGFWALVIGTFVIPSSFGFRHSALPLGDIQHHERTHGRRRVLQGDWLLQPGLAIDPLDHAPGHLVSQE